MGFPSPANLARLFGSVDGDFTHQPKEVLLALSIDGPVHRGGLKAVVVVVRALVVEAPRGAGRQRHGEIIPRLFEAVVIVLV